VTHFWVFLCHIFRVSIAFPLFID